MLAAVSGAALTMTRARFFLGQQNLLECRYPPTRAKVPGREWQETARGGSNRSDVVQGEYLACARPWSRLWRSVAPCSPAVRHRPISMTVTIRVHRSTPCLTLTAIPTHAPAAVITGLDRGLCGPVADTARCATATATKSGCSTSSKLPRRRT